MCFLKYQLNIHYDSSEPLNAVAMKYVLVFYCLDFFVDNNVTEKYIDSPLIAIYSAPEKKKQDVTKKMVYTNKNHTRHKE